MLPAEWSYVREEVVRYGDVLGAQVLDGAGEVDGIPMDHSGGDQAQAGRPEALVLEGAIADFTLSVEGLCCKPRCRPP